MTDEAFARTPEQIVADRERLKAEVEELKQKDAVGGGVPLVLTKPRQVLGPLDEAIRSALAKAEGVEARRRALPCWVAVEAGNDDAGIDACEAARAHEQCEFREIYAACPRLREPELYDRVAHNLSRGNVEERERSRILLAARRRDRKALLDVDALQVVRGVLRRKRMRVPLEDGAEVMHGGELRPSELFLTGAEVLLVLAGNPGRGKTMAACYAIGLRGGEYTVAGQWARPGLSLESLKTTPVLVVDQLGREHAGERSDFMRAQLEEVLDARYAGKRLSICVGNIDYAQFCTRYERVIVDRLAGDGVFALLSGPSMRVKGED